LRKTTITATAMNRGFGCGLACVALIYSRCYKLADFLGRMLIEKRKKLKKNSVGIK